MRKWFSLLGLAFVLPILLSAGIASAQEKVIRVPYLTNFTGTGTSFSARVWRGAEMAVNEINATGGVRGGYKIEFVKVDARSEVLRIYRDMLQAMNTGHDGSLTTVHANNPRDAISRIETLINMSGIDLPLSVVRKQISSAINLVIQASRLQGGARKVTFISEIVGMEQDTLVMQDIFKFVQDGIGEDGKAMGHFEATGVRPKCVEHLEAGGVRLPPSIFQQRALRSH